VTPLLVLAVVIYGVNALLFGALAFFYGKTALSTHAKYPLGLFIFALLLVIQCVGTAAAYLSFSSYLGGETAPFWSIMGGAELVGVVALLRITL
jgi:hypothetical protein